MAGLRRRDFIGGLLALAGASRFPSAQAHPAPITLRDIAGREVTFAQLPQRIFLGEGNLFYTVAALCRENPIAKVVGWRDNFRTADLDNYNLYCRYFPDLAKLPTFSGVQQMQFNLEKLIGLQPEVMVLNLNTRASVETSGLLDKLTAAGIPVLYVDMSIALMANTTASITLMGALFDRRARAASLNHFRQQHLDTIISRLADKHPALPNVLMERAAGLYDECCLSWGEANYGEMVTVAGGNNLAAKVIPGTYGTLSNEMVIASRPDKILVTGSNWSLYSPQGDWVNLGPGANLTQARQKLHKLMQRPAYRTLAAAQTGQVCAIWHPFYDHPFNFVAVELLATWFHPELFPDISAEETFAELFRRYLPVPWEPGYWVTLDGSLT